MLELELEEELVEEEGILDEAVLEEEEEELEEGVLELTVLEVTEELELDEALEEVTGFPQLVNVKANKIAGKKIFLFI